MNINIFKKHLHEHKMIYAAIQSFSCSSDTLSIAAVLNIQFKNYILLKMPYLLKVNVIINIIHEITSKKDYTQHLSIDFIFITLQ